MTTRGPKSHGFDVAALVLTALACGSPLLFGRVLHGDDFPFFLLYGQQAGANLREGIVLPAWAIDLNAGFGGPARLFYPPLVNWIHGTALALGANLPRAAGLLAIVGHLLSGLACRKALRLRADRVAATLGALVYMVAPYRLIDVYERSALGEHWAFIFPPLILWLGWEESLAAPRRVALTAFVVAGFLLTNLPQAILFGLLFSAWVLASGEPHGRARLVIAGSVLGGCLSAFALVPQALSSRWVRSDLYYAAREGFFRPSVNTLFSSAAIDVVLNRLVSGSLVVTALIGVLAFVLGDEAWRRSRPGRFWLGASLLFFVAATAPAGALSDHVSLLGKIQFPWRVGGPLVLTTALLAAHCRDRRVAVAVLVLMMICGAPFIGRATVDGSMLDPIPAAARGRFPDPVAMAEAGRMGRFAPFRSLNDPWFLPSGASAEVLRAIVGRPSSLPGALREQTAVLAESPATPVQVREWKRLRRRIAVNVPREDVLVWRMIPFEGMSVEIDGEPVRLAPERRWGLLSVEVPPGRHEVVWSWRPVGWFLAGRFVSLAAVLVVGMLCFPSPREAGRGWRAKRAG